MSLNLSDLVRTTLFDELDAIDGMKTILMDSETTQIVSLACPQSEIMKKGVFLFEDLTRRARCTRLAHLKCVVVVRNDPENVKNLLRELNEPRYKAYYVYFTNKVETSVVKRLAESDVDEVVKDLKELDVDFRPLWDNVFNFNLKSPIFKTSQEDLKRCAEGLRSLIRVLRFASTSPILYHGESFECDRLASRLRSITLDDESSSRTDEEGVVLILDRRYDPITPLMVHWCYLSLIHELIGLRNNKINLKTDGKTSTIALSTENDEFYKRNLFSNFGELGHTVKNLVNKYQSEVNGRGNIDGIGDIKEFIAKYPEFKKMSGTVSKHVSAVSEISALVQNRELMKVSSLEQDIACSNDRSDVSKRLKELTQDPKIRKEDLRRLFLIAALKYKDVSLLNQIKSEINTREIMAMANYFEKHSDLTAKDQRQFGQNLMQEFKTVENMYAQYQPPLKDVLNGIISGRTGTFKLKQYGNYNPSKFIVAFMLGGVTTAEIEAVHEINQSQGAKIVIGGTSLLNSESFIQEAQSAATF